MRQKEENNIYFVFEINEKDKHQKYDDPIKKSFGLLKGKINIDQMMKEMDKELWDIEK